MLIEQGEVENLGEKPWAGIELTSDTRIEEAVLHIGTWARQFLKGEPFQLLFPIQTRDLGGVTMLSPYLMARTLDLKKLKKIGSIRGVQGLECDERGRVFEIDNTFVQQVRERAEKAQQSWSEGISVGSFVRCLVGSGRMLCGNVEWRDETHARVRVELLSRDIVVTCPIRTLLNLGDVPEEKRTYFYVPGLL